MATVVGAVVMAGLVVASLSPPVTLLGRGSLGDAAPPVPVIPTFPPTDTPSTTKTATAAMPPAEPSPLLIALVQVVVVITALVVLVVLVQLVARLWRRPHITVHDDPSFEIPDVPEELLCSSARRVDLLRTGSPRNAIVAAWLDLETSAGATGLPRSPAETSTEYTERVIGVWEVDRDRLADLAALYREARFSVHPLEESHRDRALADLETLHADLARVASSRAEQTATAAAAATAEGTTGAAGTR
ncbi:MAG: hypothetical protein JWP82_1408 [Humibacillus sp.]|nr:hypothetical protein [Humibacillus sp.]